MASFELVAQEWKQGERRAAELPPEQRGVADRVVGELVAELRRLVGKLDLPGLSKDLLPIASRKRGRRRL